MRILAYLGIWFGVSCVLGLILGPIMKQHDGHWFEGGE